MLTFKWNAVLKNGHIIPQFDRGGAENSFAVVQVQDKAKQLKRFELICNKDGLAHLAVDLETGEFEIRGARFHPYNSLSLEKVDYRIVYFRRKRGYLGTNLQQIGAPHIHRLAIGWQCKLNGLNYQEIMFYDPATGGIEIRAKR